MKLNRYTDYALRVLIYLTTCETPASIVEIAEFYGISRHHLAKVVAEISALGLIKSTRGRGGGIELAADPKNVPIGEVVRAVEDLALLECFDADTNQCPIAKDCTLELLIREASEAFLDVLNRRTLADLMPVSQRLVQIGKQRGG